MLPVSFGIAPPTVIGNNRQKICPFVHILGHIFSINTFVANNGRHPQAIARIKNTPFILTDIGTHRYTNGFGYPISNQRNQYAFERRIFGTYYQFGFMINTKSFGTINQNSGIVHIIPTPPACFVGSIGNIFQIFGVPMNKIYTGYNCRVMLLGKFV